METVSVRFYEDIALVRMNNGAANPISPALVDDLADALARSRNASKGLVLNSGAKFFSIGLDLSGLMGLSRSEMTRFWYRFNDFCFDLYTLELPTVCTLAGHAVAGGCILALTCDFRFASTDNKLIGLNVMNPGLPVPYLAEMMLRHSVGDANTIGIMNTGELMGFSEAQKIGLVDEIHPMEELEEKAIQKIEGLTARGNNAYAFVKADRTREIRERYHRHGKEKHDRFLDWWFSNSGRKKVEDAARQF